MVTVLMIGLAIIILTGIPLGVAPWDCLLTPIVWQKGSVKFSPTLMLTIRIGAIMRLLTETEIDHLEQCIPEMVVHAATISRIQTLSAGLSVIESRNGELLLTEPSGAQTVIGSIPAKTSVRTGVVHKVRIKRASSTS